ncbi:MAG: hypothetical protein JWQ88_3787, partial [Rhodoferax sp.]|nr:hypothetical protein [Rhodoferax sp.]
VNRTTARVMQDTMLPALLAATHEMSRLIQLQDG